MSALRRIRVDLNLTIDELSRASGVSAEQIRNIEAGRTTNPRPVTLGKLADALTHDGQTVRPSDIDPYLSEAA